MDFKDLSIYLSKLEKTPSRNEMTAILADLFKKLSVEEIEAFLNLQKIIMNMAEKMMFRVLGNAYNIPEDKIKTEFKRVGDLGEVAYKLAPQKKSSASVLAVYKQIIEIAVDSGNESQDRKVEALAKLLRELDPMGAKFVARIPVGKLRLGFSDMTVLDALSYLLKGDKSARVEIENAFNVTADVVLIARIVKNKGLAGLAKIEPVVGTPIRPSLCERLPSAEKMLEKVGSSVAVEPKYDGVRSQVHKDGDKIKIFSRSLEDTTLMFPDLVEAVKTLPVKSAIFDGEALAYDVSADRFLPFQETIQRKRKHKVAETVKSVPLKLFIFDILYKDGVSLLALPFRERRAILATIISAKNNKIELARQDLVSDAKSIRDLVAKYLKEGLEGAVIKQVDAPYKAGARGYHWVKYKKHTDEEVADTIDCLVMGVNAGKGKRAGFGVGAFLVGIRDGDKFKTVSKIGTGLTDEQWKELQVRSAKLIAHSKPEEYDVDKNLYPDRWMKPALVVEILADEITKSPIHTSGLALRFPRLIKFRDDKNPSNITSSQELTKLFTMQKV